MEWVLLLVVVPAVVIPMVLLWGFAGCDVVFGLTGRLAVDAPTGVSAQALGSTRILVSWTDPNVEPNKYRVERLKEGTVDPVVIETTGLTLDDNTGLEEGTHYFYSVFAVRLEDGEESEQPGTADARTLRFTRAFETNLTLSQSDLQGFCIIQRIEPLRLEASGSEVRLTLHGSSVGTLLLDKITISRVAAGGDLYDAAADLTQVATGVLVQQDAIVVLPPVAYNLDHLQPLLIAFDLNPSLGLGNVRRRPNVVSDEASMFFRAASADAGVPDRVPTAANPAEVYSPSASVYIVRKIEVATNGQ